MSDPDQPQEPDLDQLADWCRGLDTRSNPIKPADLQRTPWSLTYNASCSALEALERRGDLERIDSTRLHWRPARKPKEPQVAPTEGHQLSLSDQEREVLINAIEYVLWRIPDRPGMREDDDRRAAKTLRAIRDRLGKSA